MSLGSVLHATPPLAPNVNRRLAADKAAKHFLEKSARGLLVIPRRHRTPLRGIGLFERLGTELLSQGHAKQSCVHIFSITQ